MNITNLDQYRGLLGKVADVILPQWKKMPAATRIDIANGPLDEVLNVRPDLLDDVLHALSVIDGQEIESALAYLRDNSPKLLSALMVTVVGAYYMNRDVQASLGYHGQQAQSLPRDGFGAEELVMEMMEMPSRYRVI